MDDLRSLATVPLGFVRKAHGDIWPSLAELNDIEIYNNFLTLKRQLAVVDALVSLRSIVQAGLVVSSKEKTFEQEDLLEELNKALQPVCANDSLEDVHAGPSLTNGEVSPLTPALLRNDEGSPSNGEASPLTPRGSLTPQNPLKRFEEWRALLLSTETYAQQKWGLQLAELSMSLPPPSSPTVDFPSTSDLHEPCPRTTPKNYFDGPVPEPAALGILQALAWCAKFQPVFSLLRRWGLLGAGGKGKRKGNKFLKFCSGQTRPPAEHFSVDGRVNPLLHVLKCCRFLEEELRSVPRFLFCEKLFPAMERNDLLTPVKNVENLKNFRHVLAPVYERWQVVGAETSSSTSLCRQPSPAMSEALSLAAASTLLEHSSRTAPGGRAASLSLGTLEGIELDLRELFGREQTRLIFRGGWLGDVSLRSYNICSAIGLLPALGLGADRIAALEDFPQDFLPQLARSQPPAIFRPGGNAAVHRFDAAVPGVEDIFATFQQWGFVCKKWIAMIDEVAAKIPGILAVPPIALWCMQKWQSNLADKDISVKTLFQMWEAAPAGLRKLFEPPAVVRGSPAAAVDAAVEQKTGPTSLKNPPVVQFVDIRGEVSDVVVHGDHDEDNSSQGVGAYVGLLQFWHEKFKRLPKRWECLLGSAATTAEEVERFLRRSASCAGAGVCFGFVGAELVREEVLERFVFVVGERLAGAGAGGAGGAGGGAGTTSKVKSAPGTIVVFRSARGKMERGGASLRLQTLADHAAISQHCAELFFTNALWDALKTTIQNYLNDEIGQPVYRISSERAAAGKTAWIEDQLLLASAESISKSPRHFDQSTSEAEVFEWVVFGSSVGKNTGVMRSRLECPATFVEAGNNCGASRAGGCSFFDMLRVVPICDQEFVSEFVSEGEEFVTQVRSESFEDDPYEFLSVRR